MNDKITKTDAEWKKDLTDEQFSVARKKGTERAFTGQYWDNHEKGMYRFRGFGTLLPLIEGIIPTFLVPQSVASPTGFEPVFWP